MIGKALEGWQIGGVARVQSGTSTLITSGRTTLNQNDSGFLLRNITRRELQKLIKIRKEPNGIVYWLPQSIIDNTLAAFEVGGKQLTDLKPNEPYLGPANTPGEFGERLFLQGPWQQRIDFNILKRTRVKERFTVDFRAQFLNALQEIADRQAMAKWMKEVGGPFLQVTDGVRTPEYRFNPEDCRRLGKHLNEIGKRTFGEHGVKLAYHNHMNSLGERRAEIDCILEATDAKHVWVLPDIAHLHTAEGDPVTFVRHYLNRIAYPHFKDVVIHQPWSKTLDGSTVRPKYDFVELGQGKINIPGVLQIMKDYRYQGWIIIELDRAPAGRTPKESAVISKRYVEEKLRLKV